MPELVVELRLAEQHHLQQFALLGFEVGQQAQGFQRFQRHRLRLVQAHHHALALAREIEQRVGECLSSWCWSVPGSKRTPQLVRQREHQRARIESTGWACRR